MRFTGVLEIRIAMFNLKSFTTHINDMKEVEYFGARDDEEV